MSPSDSACGLMKVLSGDMSSIGGQFATIRVVTVLDLMLVGSDTQRSRTRATRCARK